MAVLAMYHNLWPLYDTLVQCITTYGLCMIHWYNVLQCTACVVCMVTQTNVKIPSGSRRMAGVR